MSADEDLLVFEVGKNFRCDVTQSLDLKKILHNICRFDISKKKENINWSSGTARNFNNSSSIVWLHAAFSLNFRKTANLSCASSFLSIFNAWFDCSSIDMTS